MKASSECSRTTLWKRRNPERGREASRRSARNFRAAHPEKVRAARKAWGEKNKDRVREYQKRYRAENPGRFRNYELKRNYGITLADYLEMLRKQGGACAICRTSSPGGKHRTWHVDHNHTTGAVRSLLCHHCNLLLGNSGESAEVLTRAARYLEAHAAEVAR